MKSTVNDLDISLMNSKISLIRISTITLNSGTTLAIKTGYYTQQLIKIPKALTYHWASLVNHFGTFVRNTIATQSFYNEECPSKYQNTKEKNFLKLCDDKFNPLELSTIKGSH